MRVIGSWRHPPGIIDEQQFLSRPVPHTLNLASIVGYYIWNRNKLTEASGMAKACHQCSYNRAVAKIGRKFIRHEASSIRRSRKSRLLNR